MTFGSETWATVGGPMHFNERAEDYDSARPSYPAELWTTLREQGLLEPGLRALDLGAGTGQATGPLVAAGLSVTAVEPGPRLAERLRARYPGASVVADRAEDLGMPDASFDLVVAATAVHWFDLDVVLPKISRLLAPGGRFTVWRNVFGDPTVTTPFRQRVGDIVRRRDPRQRRSPDPEDLDATVERLTRGGMFELVQTSTYRWSVDLSAEHVRRLFGTFSDWSESEAAQAGAAVEELGGSVVEHYQSWLILLRPGKR